MSKITIDQIANWIVKGITVAYFAALIIIATATAYVIYGWVPFLGHINWGQAIFVGVIVLVVFGLLNEASRYTA